jgi:hypothetical protein
MPALQAPLPVNLLRVQVVFGYCTKGQ